MSKDVKSKLLKAVTMLTHHFGHGFMYEGEDTKERTPKEICCYLSRWMKRVFKIKTKATDIWNLSSSGELWAVFFLYNIARTFDDTLKGRLQDE